MSGRMDRRKFLKTLGAGGIVLLGAACAPSAPSPTPAPAKPAAPASAGAAAAPGSVQAPSGAQGLASLTTKPNKPYTIGFAVQTLSDDYFVAIAYGAEEQAKKAGVKLIFHEAGGYQYVDKQVAQIEDLIQRKVDAMIVMPTDTNGVKPVVEKAAAAGIKVATQGSTIPTDRLYTHVASDDVELGMLAGEYMGKALGGKGNVFLMAGPSGLFWAIWRADGFEKMMKDKYPDIKILAKYWTNINRFDGLKQTQDALQAFDRIDGIYGAGPGHQLGAADALSAAGKKGVIIVGTTLNKDTTDATAQGIVHFNAAQQPVLMAAISIDTAIKHLNGEQVPKRIVIPAVPVAKENLATLDRSTIDAPAGFKPSLIN